MTNLLTQEQFDKLVIFTQTNFENITEKNPTPEGTMKAFSSIIINEFTFESFKETLSQYKGEITYEISKGKKTYDLEKVKGAVKNALDVLSKQEKLNDTKVNKETDDKALVIDVKPQDAQAIAKKTVVEKYNDVITDLENKGKIPKELEGSFASQFDFSHLVSKEQEAAKNLAHKVLKDIYELTGGEKVKQDDLKVTNLDSFKAFCTLIVKIVLTAGILPVVEAIKGESIIGETTREKKNTIAANIKKLDSFGKKVEDEKNKPVKQSI
jgi:hypothetical protein